MPNVNTCQCFDGVPQTPPDTNHPSPNRCRRRGVKWLHVRCGFSETYAVLWACERHGNPSVYTAPQF